jgi:hypothetical protein
MWRQSCRRLRRAPLRTGRRAGADQPDRENTMAKGQMRSNKEVKKPKKDKAKPAVLVPSTSASRIQGSQEKTKGGK